MTDILPIKKIFGGATRARFTAVASAFTCLIAVVTSAGATQLKEARVTQVVNDVKLLLQQAAPRPAVVSDLVRTGSAVRTGTQSRSELTFADLTITRLGANTIFSFNQGTREMNLIDGAILFQVPKGKGGATITTAGVTVSITGTTGIGEFHPATSSSPLFSKWLCLEGTFRLILPNGQSIEVGPGKMVTTDGKSFSKVSDFDIAKLVKTSLFFIGFDSPLPPAVLDLIALEEQKQLDLKLASGLVDTTTQNPLDPTRIVNVINQAIVAEEAQASPSPSVSPPPPTPPPPTPPPPSPTPSKFGTPSVITSPVPYLITSGTTISTDPAITTNGVTNFGTIYRGPAIDGAFSLWAFGSTSPFDAALNIDSEFFADPNHFPIAAFKFQSLSLNGNPIIDTSNSGVTKLALIGVDGITSGPPGGTLTFTGLDLLALATVNGSINLTSDISFQDISVLAMYARGAGSNLTLDSPISNIGTLELGAEGSIQLTNGGTMSVGEFHATAGDDLTLQIGGSLLLNGSVRLNTLVLPGATLSSGANLTVNITGDYTNSSATEFSRLRVTNEGAQIGTGGNINVSIGGDLTTTGTAGDFALVVQNTNGLIDNGGNITLLVDGSVSTQGQLSLLVENYNFTANPAGHIGTGGNISLTTGGDLSADSMSVAINNRGGGVIDSGVSLVLDIGGALTTLHDGPDFLGNTESLSLGISSRYDDQAGNTAKSFIGGDATLLFHSDSASIGGILSVAISDRGGTIDGNALLNFSVTHDITVQGADDTNFPGDVAAAWQILNDDGPPGGGVVSPFGGTIHGNANLLLSATNLTLTAGSLDVDILNRNAGVSGPGGTIDSDANIIFTLTGDLTTHGAAFFRILNQLQPGGTTGGTIGGNATTNVTAANISTGVDSFGSSLAASINNRMGNIGGNAIVNVDVTNNITAQGPAVFEILNGGGTIDGNGMVSVSAANISAGSLLAQIENSNGGMIGGAANVAVNVTNDVTAPGGVTLQILNSNSGHIVTGANVLYSVGGSTSTTDLIEYIDNSNGGVIDNGGDITLHTVGPVMLDGGLVLEVDNFNGGAINNGANVTAHFVGDVTATAGQFHSFNWYVLNGSGFFNPTATGGTIGTGGNINVTFDGNASTTGTSTNGAIAAEIQNGGGGSIGTGGNISMTVGGNLTAGPLFLITENQGGHIGTGGNMTLHVSGDITTQGDANFAILNEDEGNGGGTIGSDATINVTAANISTGGSFFLAIGNDSGGSIGGSALVDVQTATDMTVSQLGMGIQNFNAGSITTGADVNLTVGGDLTVTSDGELNLYLNNFSGGSIGTDANIFASIAGNMTAGQIDVGIQNQGSGIDSNADVTADITGGLFTTASYASFFIDNFEGGTIGGDAIVNVGVSGNISTGNLSVGVNNNDGGIIGAGGNVTLTVGGNVTTTSDVTSGIQNYNAGTINSDGNVSLSVGGNLMTGQNLSLFINNFSGGRIGSNAAINVTANSISTGGVLDATINNTGGNISGNAAINMNVSSTATVTNDATFEILGSDGAAAAAININGGSYNAGGMFLAFIDGNGTITFNNASVHADVLKAGVFGSNGTLTIGGGTLSADTLLKLYAPGSNGQLNFISNVTLGGNSAKILAADSVTIFNSVVVTIGGPTPADVYTNNANYTGFGGNNSTTGTFAGAGANNPQPLANAPPFGPSSPATVTTGGNITSGRRTGSAINVSSTDELLALLDDAVPGPGGRITIRASKNTSNSRNPSRIDAAGRLNVAGRLNADRRAVGIRTASSLPGAMRLQPQ